jgi:hypothetical protein
MRRRPFRPLVCITVPAVAMIVLMTTPADTPDDRPSASGPATLDAAVSATRAVDRARVEMQTAMAGPAGPVVLVHRADFTDGGARARAESDMSQVAAALESAGQRLEGDWSQPTGVVVDGESVYSQLGPMAEALGRAPDDWTRARLADVAGPGTHVDNDTLALALDPLGPLDLLRRPVGEIGVVGTDTVRGVATEQLRASLDLGGDDGDQPPPGSFEARLAAAGVVSLPVDVWVDAEGVVRRLVLSLGAAAGSMTTTFEVFDVGAEIDVAVPDPATVIDPADVVDPSAIASPGNGSAPAVEPGNGVDPDTHR